MADEAVRIGIIGTGQIGRIHIDRYAKIPGVKIVAVADVKREAAEAAAAVAGGAKVFTDFRELLKLDEIQAVDVCLHNNFHAPITVAAMEAGKDVFCEKPMAGSYADAKTMYDAMKRTGRRLQMQLNTLFSPETKAAKRLIDAGTLGKLYFARSVGFRRRGRCYVDGYGSTSFVQKQISAGGALYDMGVYHIGQMLYLLGNPAPRTMSGSTFQELEMYPDRREESHFDVEELGLGYVRFANGAVLMIEESWAINLGSLGQPAVAGSKGGLSFEPLTLHKTEADLEVDAAVQVQQADTRWHRAMPQYSAFDSPQHHWIATLNGTVMNPVDTATIGLNTMLISEGIYLSQQLGREVTAEEVAQHSKSTAAKV